VIATVARLRSALRSWTAGSTNRRIFSAAAVVAVMTTVVRAVGMLKELLVAWRFGRSDEIDAFLVAFAVPSFAVSVIAWSFGPALIPAFVRVRDSRGIDAARQLYGSVVLWSLGLLALATLGTVVTAPLYLPSLASGFSSEKLAFTAHLLYWMAPLIILAGLAAVSGAILNAGERFALPALTPLLPLAGTAAGALFAAGRRGALAMAVGLLAGHLVEAVVLVAWLARSGFTLRSLRPTVDPDTRQVLGQYLPMVAGSLLMVSTQIVDQAMAAMLPAGSVAALSYGNKIMAVPLNIAVTALGTAVIPYLSALVARHDWGAVEHSVRKYVGLGFLASLPATLVLAFGASPIVRLVFERGAFTAGDTRVVAGVQALASLQIPFYVAGILAVRAISAMSVNRVLVWGNVINCAVNIGLNWLFMRWLGVAGIALSTSVMYAVSFSYLYWSYSRRLAALRGAGPV
jgi:putative peptidoglycan lipid II flippase